MAEISGREQSHQSALTLSKTQTSLMGIDVTDPESLAATARLKAFGEAFQTIITLTPLPKFNLLGLPGRDTPEWMAIADAFQHVREFTCRELEQRHFPTDELFDGECCDALRKIGRIVGLSDAEIDESTFGEIWDEAIAWADRQKIQAKLTADALEERLQGGRLATGTDRESEAASEIPKRRGTRRGRKSLDAETVAKRNELIQRWQKAKEAGESQKDFCKANGVTITHLTTCMGWADTRKRREKTANPTNAVKGK